MDVGNSFRSILKESIMFRYMVLFAVLICNANGNGIGAPETACNAMMPGHGFSAQTSAPPFRLVLSGSEKFTVTISSTKAVTHTDSYDKVSDELSFTWIPPDDVCGNFVFMATIAKNYTTIWKSIISERVTIKCPTTTTTTTTTSTTTKPVTTTIAQAITTTVKQETTKTNSETTTESTQATSTNSETTTESTQATSTKKVDTTTKTQLSTTTIPSSTISSTVSTTGYRVKLDSDCDVTKGCLHDCENGNCNYIITWRNLQDIIEFEITTKLPATGNQWVAIGFSADKLMGDDSVIACKIMDGVVSVTQLYNTMPYKQNIPIQNGNVGLTFVSGSFGDNVLNCRFQRLKVITGEPYLFNLTEPWHILFGLGQLSSSGMLMKHDTNPIASATKADFLSIKSVRGEKIVYTMVKIHATLMLVAWMLFASIGIVTARYFKDMWPNSKLCGVKVWFTINPRDGLQFAKTHPILGIIVTGLTLINPIMALFRPDPDGKRRPIFNGLHWLVGTGAFILAIVTIVFGQYLDKAGMPQIAVYITDWVWWCICFNRNCFRNINLLFKA
ncbi:hypothetical protein KUTeg_006962 [Tegillarca granosa]|uniref:DOMON domain-containing protein n=1 Tax=Tegillarca granosa TaxID=220873 RepID=A0ABQ9FBV7_TEGGR|nr:hypothetical protein KUTeg_006962 [Tegillarca granosa]